MYQRRILRRMLLEPLEVRHLLAALPTSAVPPTIHVDYDGNPQVLYPSAAYHFSPLDLSAADGVGFDVTNNSALVARVGVVIESADGADTILLQNVQPRQQVKFGAVFSNERKVFGLPFTESGVKWMDSQQLQANPTNVTGLTFFLDRPTTATSITINKIRTLDFIPLDDPLIDKFGQYTRRDWAGKADSDAELTQLIQADIAHTNALPKPQDQDKYGGLLNSGVTFNASTFVGTPGHFRAAKDMSGRWWLVTPLGNPFWQVGVNSARPHGGSPVEGREQLFEPVSPLDADGVYDFYAHSVDRYNEVAGPDASWEARTLTRLQGWGFNSLGNWPEGSLLNPIDDAPRLPYTRTVYQQRTRLMPQTNWHGTDSLPSTANFPGTDYSVPVFYTGQGRYVFPDVFSQRFLDYVKKELVYLPDGTPVEGFFNTPGVAKTNDDPYAIGFFVDNEIRWSGGEREENAALPKAAINLVGSLVRQKFLQELATKYSSAGSLLTAWGVSLSPALADSNHTPVTAIGARTFVFPETLNATAQHDLTELLGVYAEQYYRTVREGFKAHMPNKLYLGSRLYEGSAPPSVLQAAAKYVDVLSINLYRKPIDVAKIDWSPFAALNKPLIVGEFGYVATDEGHFTGFHQNRDTASQAEKGSLYQKYMDLISRNPLFVGASVFQYADTLASGRPGSYENFNFGLVDVLDLPHTDYVARVSDWNHASYKTRLGQLPANHAPVLDENVAANLTTVQQWARNSYGTPVGQLLAGVTDADSKAERGIAVTSLSNQANGNWQYTLDGGASWFNFAPVSASSARLLPAAGNYSRIRFQPNGDFTGTVKIGFFAWDQKQGYTQGSFNLSGAGKLGGVKAFSANHRTSSLLITAAPILNLSGSVGYVRNAPAIVLASGATVVDSLHTQLGGGQLRVQITTGANAADRLTIGGSFTISSGNVQLRGVTIGTLTTGGLDSTALLVDLNQNATLDRVQKLVRAIKFSTTTKTGPRTISFTLSDGEEVSPAAVKRVNVS